MKNYSITVEQVSKSRNRYFSVLVNGKHIGEISCNKPSFGLDYAAEKFVETVFENAYQMARRVIIHSFEKDIDVFTKGFAKMDFGDYKIRDYDNNI